MTVPVQHEVVRVEYVPTSGGPSRTVGAFQEEIGRHPRSSRGHRAGEAPGGARGGRPLPARPREGTETIATTVRREEIDIVTEGDLTERELPTGGAAALRKAG